MKMENELKDTAPTDDAVRAGEKEKTFPTSIVANPTRKVNIRTQAALANCYRYILSASWALLDPDSLGGQE